MNLPEALHLGSLTLSTTVAMWLVVLCLASWLGARIVKTQKMAFDGWFYGVLLLALVVGRAVFVAILGGIRRCVGQNHRCA